MVPQPAPRDALEAVHAAEYLDYLERIAGAGGGAIDPDTYVGEGSVMVAARAAGACCLAAEQALDNGARSFCITRPPGHHASPARGMGFCLINNVAVAAAHARREGAARVVVVDYDVHHGNGTQEIFWADPAVLYISLHQYPWYPWKSGALDEVGGEGGLGANVNIPLPAMTGDAVYIEAVRQVVVPLIEEFGPGLLIVSAGFDAHRSDPLSLMEMTEAGFGVVTSLLVKAAERIGAGVVMALEGGYDIDALRCSFVAAARALAGECAVDGSGLTEGSPLLMHGVERAREFHARLWPVLER